MKPQTPLLAKVTSPRLPKIVERKRLYAVLDEARQQPLIWITAPAGMGKTTLAASYLKARKLKSLWYQIDEGDADPATLFHYLGIAAKKIAPRYKNPLPHLTPEYLPGLPIFTRRFFEQFYQRMKTSGVLVFDNFHNIESDPAVHDLFKIALEVVPPDSHVLILSRLPPPSAFAKFLAGQMLSVIPEDSLRLTLEETKALIDLKHPPKGQALTTEAKHLHQLTQGWMAGAILCLEQPSPETTISANEHNPPEIVFDYLAQEVMNMLPQETQEILLRLAYTPFFTSSMAEQLSGNPQAPSIILGLFHHRYFLEQRGDSLRSYQFHPLFKLFLQNLAHQQLPQGIQRGVQQQTATLLAQHGHIEDAITLLLEIAQFTEAETLLLQHVTKIFTQGRTQIIAQWILHFPEEICDRRPWLQFWSGQACRTQNLYQAQESFQKAFEQFEQHQDIDGQLSAWCALVETIMQTWGDWSILKTWIDRILPLLKAIPDFPNTPLHAHVAFDLFSISSMFLFTHSERAQWEAQAMNMLDEYPLLPAQLPAGFLVPLAFINRGNIIKASRVLQNMQSDQPFGQLSTLTQLSFHYADAHVEWMSGRILEAKTLIEKGLALGRETGCLVFELPLTFLNAWVAWFS